METQKLRINSDYHLSDLISDIDKGDLRLPRFQRDYVWNRPKVIGLLDSIYNEFPIGSFFIWKADSKYKSLYKNVAELNLPEPEDESQLRYILDGQQRATSLYVAIKGLEVNGIDYSKICFDLEEEKFSASHPNGVNLIALRDIVEMSSSLRLMSSIKPEYQNTFYRCAMLFRSYNLSVVEVREMELGNAIEIFERINKGGVRLGTFDLVVASTWSETFDLKVEYEKLREELKAMNYGSLPPEVVSQTIALILKKFSTRAHQLSIDGKQLENEWKEIDTAIRSALSYMRNNFGAYSIEFLPYPSMTALVAYAFYQVKGRSLTPHLSATIDQWYWKSALNERYSATLENKLGDDRRDIIDKALRGEEVRIENPSLSAERILSVSISNRSSIRNAFFCMLALKHPKHFKTGERIALIDVLTSYGAIEKHHVFPRAFLRDNSIGNENTISNFCFIPAELNKEITDRKPSDYFADYNQQNNTFDNTLASHLLVYNQVIKDDNYSVFLSERANSILHEFELLAGSKFERDFEGNANKVIDSLELSIRQLIASQCAVTWERSISKKLQEKIDERIKSEERHTATINAHVTYLEQLRQLDVPDYMNIIENNWSLFSDRFESVELMRSRFNAFRRYRNDIKHSRLMDDVIRNEGKAAIEWLSRTAK